jgi:hypothetical protein
MATTRIPFAFARSALFNLPPDWLSGSTPQPIAAAQDYEIAVEYAGPRLTCHHAAAWQAVVALAYKGQGEPVGTDLRLVDLLRAMGVVSVQMHAKKRLLRWLAELADKDAQVYVKTPRHTYLGKLILDAQDIGRGRVRVELPAALLPLLEDETVRLPMAGRAAFNVYPLAAWLHDYIASHRSVYEVKLDTLRSLSGSVLSRHHFKARLVRALDRVKARAGFFTGYTITGEVLTLRKEKTRVVLLGEKNQAVKGGEYRQARAIAVARLQRSRVPL